MSLPSSGTRSTYIGELIAEHRFLALFAFSTILLTTQALLQSKLSIEGHQHHPSESMSITLLFEFAKLALSGFLLFTGTSRKNTRRAMQSWNWRESHLYFVPAALYIITDNLMFYLLRIMDPATYEVLSTFKIITTSFLLRVFLNVKLNRVQWPAVILLVVGSAVSQLVTCGSHIISNVSRDGFLWTFVYCSVAGFSGVFTEYLFKKQQGGAALLYLQNMALHSAGLLVNGCVLIMFFSKELSEQGIFALAGRNGYTWLLVCNHALSGLTVSALLKYADNTARVYSHALSMVVTMGFSSLVYREVPSIQLIFGVTIVIISLWLFYLPVDQLRGGEDQK